MPPGKVCDFFGFQYMRDIDAAEKGHNPMFLDRVAGNVLKTLNDDAAQTISRPWPAEQAAQLNDACQEASGRSSRRSAAN